MGHVARNLSRKTARIGTQDSRVDGLDGGAFLSARHRSDHRSEIGSGYEPRKSNRSRAADNQGVACRLDGLPARASRGLRWRITLQGRARLVDTTQSGPCIFIWADLRIVLFEKSYEPWGRPHLGTRLCISRVDHDPRRSRSFIFSLWPPWEHVRRCAGAFSGLGRLPRLPWNACRASLGGSWRVPRQDRAASVQLGTSHRCWRLLRVARRNDIWTLDVRRGFFPAACRLGRNSFTRDDGRTAFWHCHLDRCNVRTALPARRSRLWFVDGLGFGLRHFLVVLWPADHIADAGKNRSRLVCRSR